MTARDLRYRAVVAAAKLGFRLLGQRISVEGAEHIPAEGPALLACNHVSYVDFVYAGLAAQPRLVRFMAKRELFDHRLSGPVMRSMRHIPVDRARGESSVRLALSSLAAGELVGIFPEATISRALELKSFKSGVVRIAATAKVPVVPVVVWGTQRLLTKDHPRDLSRGLPISIVVGPPLHPSGEDPELETEALKASMGGLLDRAVTQYPAGMPTGVWWLPSRYGGGAPSLEEAAALDAEERARRIARRRDH